MMTVLSGTHGMFGRMRLKDYLPADDLVLFGDWEYLDRTWCGESWGAFTELLRLQDEPDVARSIALDLTALPSPASAAVLAALALPLIPGMSLEEVAAILGPPAGSFTYMADRVTYAWQISAIDTYAVQCTVHHVKGLTYLTIHTLPLPTRHR